MISLCKSKEGVKSILDYIGDDFKSVPYLYVDVVKYGAGAPNVRTWMDYDAAGIMRGVYLLYYDCLHFFTKDNGRYPLETLLNAVVFLNPKVIMAQQDIGDRMKNRIDNAYVLKRNYLIDLNHTKPNDEDNVCEVASRGDIKKIVDIMMTEPVYSSVYDRDTLEKQMLERYDDHFSHCFVIREGQELAAAYTTFAEVDRMILLGSIIVNPTYRGKGYAGKLITYACRFFSGERLTKVSFINYNNASSLSAHAKVGGFPAGTLYKFVKE